MTDVLGLHRTSTRVSIDSVASFAGSGNTKKAYKKFCRYLFQIGVTSEMISQKEAEILDIFKLQGTAIRGLADNGNIADRSQLPAVRCFGVGILFVFEKFTDRKSEAV